MRRLVALAVLALVTVGAAGCGVGLLHGLDEAQANEVVAALDRAGIAADKAGDDAQGRWKVVVPRGEMARAVAVLEARSLPRRPVKGVAEAFADGAGGLFPSAAAERARLEASLAADLERTLERLPGVRTARVHLVLPPDDPLRGDDAHPRPTAAVLLDAAAPIAAGEAEVRRLVAGAVEGLQAADVSVVVARGAADPPAPALVGLGPLRVAAASRDLTVALGSAALVVVLALALAVVALGLRLASLRRRMPDKGDGRGQVG
jgi:type III secretion protein J